MAEWREVEAHDLSNADAKPLTLPSQLILRKLLRDFHLSVVAVASRSRGSSPLAIANLEYSSTDGLN